MKHERSLMWGMFSIADIDRQLAIGLQVASRISEWSLATRQQGKGDLCLTTAKTKFC